MFEFGQAQDKTTYIATMTLSDPKVAPLIFLTHILYCLYLELLTKLVNKKDWHV